MGASEPIRSSIETSIVGNENCNILKTKVKRLKKFWNTFFSFLIGLRMDLNRNVYFLYRTVSNLRLFVSISYKYRSKCIFIVMKPSKSLVHIGRKNTDEVNFTKTYRKESAFCINVDDYQKLKDEMFRYYAMKLPKFTQSTYGNEDTRRHLHQSIEEPITHLINNEKKLLSLEKGLFSLLTFCLQSILTLRLTKGTNTPVQLINCTWHREQEKDVAASKVTLKTPLRNLIDSRSPIGCKHCSSNFTNAKNSLGKRQLKDFFPTLKNAFMKGVCDRLIIVSWAERDMKFIAKIQINYFEGKSFICVAKLNLSKQLSGNVSEKSLEKKLAHLILASNVLNPPYLIAQDNHQINLYLKKVETTPPEDPQSVYLKFKSLNPKWPFVLSRQDD
ncbi:hypothetical protein EGR_06244 [Echinococcus granulosus]|uniref:Uncharacterized protein n=1 Tax=Echinococcus granulosus TaxID=6210 RepID=W6UC05_ECHGR|nr:hypothetical protein EGR_06244 [Echinococcus granulosus]EUB58928.1 hypothetical protein EGR_06244 [Echinococcus granulosus]